MSRPVDPTDSQTGVRSDRVVRVSKSSVNETETPGCNSATPGRRPSEEYGDLRERKRHSTGFRRSQLQWNRIKVCDRATGLVDMMFVFTRKARKGDDFRLLENTAGKEDANPTPYSACWYLQKVLVDESMFRVDKKMKVLRGVTKLRNQTTVVVEEDADEIEDIDKENSAPEETTMQELATQERSSLLFADVGGGSPDLKALYMMAKASKTLGEFRESLCRLLVGYILSENCGFEARVFSSGDGQESDVFVGVSARESILRAHADLLKYRIQLAHDVAIDLLTQVDPKKGKTTGNQPPEAGLFDEEEICPPFIEFDVDDEEQFMRKYGRTPFKEHRGEYGETRSIFMGGDRIRIITEVIHQAFNVEAMTSLGLLKHSYPCHNQERLHRISRSWCLPAFSERHKFHWKARSDNIAAYFGTKLGFRIDFLRFLTQRIFLLAVVAPILLFLPDQHLVRTLIGLGLIIWSATVEEFWKRREAATLVRWGVEEHEINEGGKRPQFFGDMLRSEVDRITLERVYPRWKKFLRRLTTWTITFLYQAFMVSVSLHLYHFHDKFEAEGRGRLAFGCLCAVALQIRVCDMFWDYFGQWLGNFDNYETDSEYHDALLQRTFGVRFIVSFASLFYIAFVKHFGMGCGGGERDCLDLVASQLRMLFATNMLFHLLSVIIPFVTFRYQMHCTESSVKRPSVQENGYVGLSTEAGLYDETPRRRTMYENMTKSVSGLAKNYPSFPETQSKMPEYSLAEEVFDVMDVMVELGYVLFFGFVAPEVLTLFLLSNCLRLHALGWKLVYTMRRPFPNGACGLGVVFHKIFHMMARAAVACNILVLLLSNSDYRESSDYFMWLKELLSTPLEGEQRTRDWKSMIVVFFVTDTAVSILRWAIDLVIPDVPAAVVLDQARKDRIQAQLIHRATSELKRWEGKELEQAYHEIPPTDKKPQILTSIDGGARKQWTPTSDIDDISHACQWQAQDSGFEKPWLLDLMSGEQPEEDLMVCTSEDV